MTEPVSPLHNSRCRTPVARGSKKCPDKREEAVVESQSHVVVGPRIFTSSAYLGFASSKVGNQAFGLEDLLHGFMMMECACLFDKVSVVRKRAS